MRSLALVLFGAFALSRGAAIAAAQVPSSGVPAAMSATLTDERISIDGQLDEASWKRAIPATAFRQRDPIEGDPATERSELRVLYDDKAVYIGVRLLDRDPSRIVSRMARRDSEGDADQFTVYLDPYHDHLTGAMFLVSAAGVQYDAAISNDTQLDSTWDAVWESTVSRDGTGWALEMRISFSQLRFSRADVHTWGINAARYIQRKNETSWLFLTPKAEFGLASRMGHLERLERIEAARNIEILPYVRASAEFGPGQPANPFNDGSRTLGGVGLDFKYGINSGMTLNATVNPDFGQVEVDPAVVNLTAFETFFEEKRPFFLEGSQIFQSFGGGGGIYGPTVIDANHFYSRRIGRPPQGFASGDVVEQPVSTTILGAAKLTGKFRQNWTVGVLHAVTGRERAKVLNGSSLSRMAVEPLTNHLVARLNREFPGRAALGMMMTGVERQLDEPALASLLPNRAYTIGGDGYYFFDRERMWGLTGRMSGSWLGGTSAAIDRLQRTPARYFQRPDMKSKRLNPLATSMRGWSGSATLGKTSGGWTATSSLSANSPGFDTNDIGFLIQSDAWGNSNQFQWRQLKPDRISRTRSLVVQESFVWNFDRQVIDYSGTNVSGELTFLNYWSMHGGGFWGREAQDDRLTRGGPSAISPRCRGGNVGGSSDSRRTIAFDVSASGHGCEFGAFNRGASASVTLKPSRSVTASIETGLNRSRNSAQYLSVFDDATAVAMFGKRYLFADIDQRTFSATTRASVSLSPRVSLQTFSQLLLAKGRYTSFKELSTPNTYVFRRYGQDIGTISFVNGIYTFDPDDTDRAPSFSVPDPDFDFKSLRVNAVFRWEWKPGSTTYVVWTQTRDDGAKSTGRDLRELFAAPPYNVFLVKISYWLGR